MNIDIIRSKCKDSLIEVTGHMLMRFQQRNISYEEIKQVILNGEIIEEYEDDYPYPSCLISGRTVKNRAIHVVVGISEKKLWFITTYEPDLSQWENDFKTRKGR